MPGVSSSKPKTHSHMPHLEEYLKSQITVSLSLVKMPKTDLTVSAKGHSYTISGLLLDSGSQGDLLSETRFLRLGLSRADLRPTNIIVKGISSQTIKPLGIIDLPTRCSCKQTCAKHMTNCSCQQACANHMAQSCSLLVMPNFGETAILGFKSSVAMGFLRINIDSSSHKDKVKANLGAIKSRIE